MKYYQKEKSKLGNAPGTIINWSKEIANSDPNTAANVRDLPAGYLPCDGQIYNANQYPQLAAILGTGAASIYKKEDATLSNTQFQVPDLGSKHIEAATSGNVGIQRNMTKTIGTGSDATEIQKAGVGVEIISNIGNTATVGFNGVFTVPTQNFALNGNIGWTLPTVTEQESVPINAIGSHMHYTTTHWVAIKEDPAVTNRSQPSYVRAADMNVNVYYGGAFPFCDARAREYHSAMDSNLNGEGNCSGCTTWNKYFVGWTTGGGTQSSNAMAAASGTYASLWTTGLNYISKTAASWPNNTTIRLGDCSPYDTRVSDSTFTYPSARNLLEATESPPGSELSDRTAHTHRIGRSIGDTSYTATTDVTTVRPDGLQADVNIRTSNIAKFDDIVSPYFVLEYLIKY
tara:strand:- start:4268 stop:5470 length:1203 start_codon:yes stop_codon:yes gene_type:complete